MQTADTGTRVTLTSDTSTRDTPTGDGHEAAQAPRCPKPAARPARGVAWASGAAGRYSGPLPAAILFSFASVGLITPIARLPVATAIAGAVLFERSLVSPLWNFLMRFASKPARTLESALADEATAVTAFDSNGQGIVSLEVDGQIQQILATLTPEDRRLGVHVRAGQQVRIDDVDAERNRCTVSLLTP